MKISDGYPLAGRCGLRQEGEKGFHEQAKAPVTVDCFEQALLPGRNREIAAASAYFTLVLAGKLFQENVNTVVLESDANLSSKY